MRTYDLIVLGAGSGNMLFTPELGGMRAAIVEPDRFGGTCLNRGCIPSKMLVLAADAARGVTEAARLGIDAHVDHVDWPAIRDRVFGRIDPLHQQAVDFRCSNGIDVYDEPARFVGPKVLQVGTDTITAETVVVAVGSRPDQPAVAGLDTVAHHTSDTIMRIDEIPRSLIVLGGGFIAAEMGHVFEAFGSRVHIIQRGPRLLMAEDLDVATRFTEMAAARFDLRLRTTATLVAEAGDGVAVTVEGPQGHAVIEADVLLVATGRRPNTDKIDATAGGLDLDAHGHVVTDEIYRTNVPGVWSLGDATNHFQLKHMANAEMRVVAHNLAHPGDLRTLPSSLAPHAVFSDPQVASVGATEAQLVAAGIDYVVGTRHFGDVAYGWALEDTTGFAKVLADPHTRLLLGVHILGPQAATLLQPLLQAMHLGQTVDQLACDVLYVHPALTEVLELVLLDLVDATPA